VLAVAASVALAVPVARISARDLEYQVKAAFLLNFAKFTEFPADSFEHDGAPVSLCVFADNPFGNTLAQTLVDERAGGRPVQARTINSASEARRCHMVFVPRSQSSQADAVVAATADRAIVTIGESSTFLDHGGTINLFVEDGRIRFAMRPGDVERHGVRFSSHLLRLARHRPDPPELPR
jgi:hypothetical protein